MFNSKFPEIFKDELGKAGGVPLVLKEKVEKDLNRLTAIRRIGILNLTEYSE